MTHRMSVVPVRLAAPAVAVCFMLAGLGAARAAAPSRVPDDRKPRIVAMTDIGGDPDDQQSMVRFLLYTCDYQVEGLCTGFGHGHYQKTRPELIRKAVEAYGKVLPNLRKHRRDFPSHEHLLSLIKDGSNGDAHSAGPGRDSQASDWIIRVLDRPDPRPVWFSIWGGPRELAQAIWKVAKTRPRQEAAAFRKKIRVHSIADQDRTAGWVKTNHPDVFWIFSNRLFRGIWAGGDQKIVSPEWLEKHVRTGHGPLGPLYPAKAAGKAGVKEGDTPSFLYVLPDGLSDPEHPEWGNWGGRFRPAGKGCEYVPVADIENGRPNSMYSIQRWRTAYQNAFEARMDWCVKPFDGANHEPAAALNGEVGTGVLRIKTDPGAEVKLSAAGSSDPDGDTLACTWWTYVEPGTYWAEVPIRGADQHDAVVTVPQDASGRTVHIICEVTDDGRPPLTAYRRAILEVSGQKAPSPAGADRPDLGKPITRLSGPPAKTGPWTFYRGINVGGGPVEIDGQRWAGDDAKDFVCQDRRLNSPQVRLMPPTDPARAKMIHAFRWNQEPRLVLTGVPKGRYAVYTYVWEETSPETLTISLNGRAVAQGYNSGEAGQWQRLGPWEIDVTGGRIEITSRGGAANFSGIEVWRKAK